MPISKKEIRRRKRVKLYVTLTDLEKKGYGRKRIWRQLFSVAEKEIPKYVKVVQSLRKPKTKICLLDNEFEEIKEKIKSMNYREANNFVQEKILKNLVAFYIKNAGGIRQKVVCGNNARIYDIRTTFRSQKFKSFVDLIENEKT